MGDDQVARMRAALEAVCSVLFQDAVNGHLSGGEQFVTRGELEELYEVARLALLE